MSEKMPMGPEHETLRPIEHHEQERPTQEKHEASEHHKEDKGERLETIRHSVEQEAVSGKDVKLDSAAEDKAPSQHLITKDLRHDMLQRTLVRIRKQLPARSRQFSKVVHSKPVDKLSSVGEKTVARPVGLFGGGLAALLGSAFMLYMSRQYGFEYNFLLFFILFIGGYALASLVELLLFSYRRARHGKR